MWMGYTQVFIVLSFELFYVFEISQNKKLGKVS